MGIWSTRCWEINDLPADSQTKRLRLLRSGLHDAHHGSGQSLYRYSCGQSDKGFDEEQAPKGLEQYQLNMNSLFPKRKYVLISIQKGFPYEDAKTILKTSKAMQSVWAGKVEGLVELHRPLLSIACREIFNQKRRLGGTFAVAHAVSSRENRDFCRQGIYF